MLKSQNVTNYIEKCLERNCLDESEPLTINRIAQELGVNQRTVDKGLEPFLKRNILKKVKGKGIFWVEERERVIRGTTGMIMPSSGHFWGELCSAIAEKLCQRKYSPYIINTLEADQETDPEPRVKELSKLDPTAYIIDGASYFARQYLSKYVGDRAVILNTFESSESISGNRIFIDYEQGALAATQHLARLGCRNIVLATHQPWEHLRGESWFQDGPYAQNERGYFRAMREAELKENVFWWNRHDRRDSKPELHRILDQAKEQVGFVCGSDFTAVNIMREVFKRGLSIPEDVAFVGFMDTAWAKNSIIPLSSMRVEIDEMAELAATYAMAENIDKNITIKICPRLIVRESSTKQEVRDECSA